MRENGESEFAVAEEEAEATEPDSDGLFDHVFADAPSLLERQREELRAWLAGRGDPSG